MDGETLVQAVRQELSLGRLAPLGTPADGAWLAERAAAPVLRAAVRAAVPTARLHVVRPAVAGPVTGPFAVPPPPGALPPGPVLLQARCALPPGRPLPEQAAELRLALATAAGERLGLDLAGVDVTVAELLDEPPDRVAGPRERDGERGEPARPALAPVPAAGAEATVATAVLAVPGVVGLAAHGGQGAGVRLTRTASGPLLRLGLVLDGSRRALDVAREVRAAAAGALPGAAAGASPAVSLLITDLTGPGPA